MARAAHAIWPTPTRGEAEIGRAGSRHTCVPSPGALARAAPPCRRRLGELLKYEHRQVPTAQLEGILPMRPQIFRACAATVRDEEAGEVPMAFVVPRERELIDRQEGTVSAPRHVLHSAAPRACLPFGVLAGRERAVRP
jgi:hypothetical protein